MTQSFATQTTGMPAPTKPISIATQGFTLSSVFDATNTSVLSFSQLAPGGVPVTISGTVLGANGPGVGQVAFTGTRTAIINNGSITGGQGGTGAGGLGVRGLTQSSITNNGLILGGDSVTSGGGVGVDIATGSTLTNHGTIRGGNGPLNGTIGAGSGVYLRLNAGQIVNTGTIEGGAGGIAITGNSTVTNYVITNSGTIRAGAGQADAIRLISGASNFIDLELQAGSVIEGNVVANPTGLLDTLRLGGTADSSFDVSEIGPSAQYPEFRRLH